MPILSLPGEVFFSILYYTYRNFLERFQGELKKWYLKSCPNLMSPKTLANDSELYKTIQLYGI